MFYLEIELFGHEFTINLRQKRPVIPPEPSFRQLMSNHEGQFEANGSAWRDMKEVELGFGFQGDI